MLERFLDWLFSGSDWKPVIFVVVLGMAFGLTLRYFGLVPYFHPVNWSDDDRAILFWFAL